MNTQPLLMQKVSPAANLQLNAQPLAAKTQLQTMPPAAKLNMPATKMMLNKQPMGQIR
jgi:hypothetical protein